MSKQHRPPTPSLLPGSGGRGSGGLRELPERSLSELREELLLGDSLDSGGGGGRRGLDLGFLGGAGLSGGVEEPVEQTLDPSDLDELIVEQPRTVPEHSLADLEKDLVLDESVPDFRRRVEGLGSYEDQLQDEEHFVETAVQDPRTLQRLEVAARAIAWVNSEVMLYGAGNQKEDIVATRGVSRSRTEDSRRSSKFTRTRFGPGFGDVRDNKTQDEGADEARATVKGQHWKAGVCDDYANVTLDYLREHLGGHTLNKMGKDKHAFVIIGDMQTESDDQLVVADPWPTRPQACLWSDHFCYSPGEDRPAPKRSYEAPGKKHKDVRGELEFGKKKAARSSKQSPVGLQQTVDQARKGDDIWFERTTTRNGKAIFYVDPQWGREEKARRREAFRQTLLESMHLGKKARKKLGI